MENLQVICDGIGDDKKFLPVHTGRGEDLSPGFHLSSLPQGTQTLAIVLRDESHPLFGSMTHWLIWDLPASCDIEMNIPKKGNPGRGEARQGIAYGWHRYRGPKPPRGTTHKYVFTVFAVSQKLDLGGLTTYNRLLESLQDKVLGKGSVEGFYE